MFAVFNPYLTDNNFCWASELIHRHDTALTITNVSVMHRYVQVNKLSDLLFTHAACFIYVSGAFALCL